jgi:hypothetical protein
MMTMHENTVSSVQDALCNILHVQDNIQTWSTTDNDFQYDRMYMGPLYIVSREHWDRFPYKLL